ncbi:hypothetical protein ACQTPQ_07520 [Streptococcus hyovaginalis]|uniref:hypothetical protein n=1 Tax=Streptococcus hyovaginalis TaxID=149015 RepID=UPI003AE476BD
METLIKLLDNLTDDMIVHPLRYQIIASLLGIPLGMLIYYIILRYDILTNLNN